MGRSEVDVKIAYINSATGAVTADDVDSSNGNFLDISDMKDDRLAIRIYGGSGDDWQCTFKAGDLSDSSIGDLEVDIASTEIKVITLESARFKDTDEYILIDAATTATSGITAATLEAYVLN